MLLFYPELSTELLPAIRAVYPAPRHSSAKWHVFINREQAACLPGVTPRLDEHAVRSDLKAGTWWREVIVSPDVLRGLWTSPLELVWIKDTLSVPLKHLPSGAFPHVVGSLNRTALGAAFQPLQPDSCTRQSAAGRPEEILPAWGWEKKKYNPTKSFAAKPQHYSIRTCLIHE